MIKWLLTGGALPPFLLGCGVFFILYLRGYPMRAPRRALRALCQREEANKESPFRAVTLALAGTLGVGNIVGVANAIGVGGAGAILWMWLSALVASVLKYAEIVCAVGHRRSGKQGFFGGACYYVRDCFERLGRHRLAGLLSVAFAVLTIANALSMGCVIQVNAVCAAFDGVFGIPRWCCGVGLALCTLPVLIGGSKRVASLTELLVPIMTLGFLLLSGVALFMRRELIASALAEILRDALSPKSAAGGFLGFLSSKAVRIGTMRGLLSNEGGCGTAPTAHAHANAKSPAAQGVWGIFEVFVDTILLCTVTALVILVAPTDAMGSSDAGVMTTINAYAAVLGDWAACFFAVAVLCFGYATLLCWGSYGLENLSFLTKRPTARGLYFALLTGCVLLGAVAAPEGLFALADFAIATLTSLNLIVLLLMRKEIRRETLCSFAPSRAAPLR